MKTIPCLIGCALLISHPGVRADAFNGRVKGAVDGRPLDVAVVCNREAMGGRNWLTAQSDPSMHGGLRDRNGDGVALSISSNGEQAVFEVLLAGRRYRFVGTRDVAFAAHGLTIEATMKHYEGKGRERKEVGQYGVELALDCTGG